MQQDPRYPPQSGPNQYPSQQFPSGQYPQNPSGPMYPSGPTYPGVQSGPQTPYPQPAPQIVYQRNTSFTMKAVVAYLLYFVGYVPGLIFNVMFLNEANNVKKEIGRTPEGMGCLWATLIGSLVPLIVFFSICASLGLLGSHH